jgi:hypothetical protein
MRVPMTPSPAKLTPLLRASRPAAAWLMVALFGTLLAFAAAQPLHLIHHEDAGHADHHCVITEFAAGQAEVAAAPLSLSPIPWVTLPRLSPPDAARFTSRDLRLAPGRAPPGLS